MQTYKLWEIADYINGRAFKPTEREMEGLPIIRIQNLNNSDTIFNYSSKNIDKKYLVEDWDLLFARSWSLWAFIRNRGDAWLNQHIFKIIQNKQIIDKKYFYYLLLSLIKNFESRTHGATMVHITKPEFMNTKINLPPLATQRTIVDKLDKLQSLIDLKKQAITKTNELTKAIFLEMFGDPMTNEKGWEVRKMKSICNKITDWTHDTPERLKKWIMFITWKNIRQFQFDLSDLDYVSSEVHEIIYQRCNPEYEDVLYTNIWVNMWTAVLNTFKFPFSMKNVALFKPNRNNLIWYYLTHLLNFQQFKTTLLWNNWKWWAQWFLSLDVLRNLNIPLPPLSLQQKFADIITKLQASTDKHKQALAKLEELYQATMQSSFKL